MNTLESLVHTIEGLRRDLRWQSRIMPPNIIVVQAEYTLNGADTITLTGYDKIRSIVVDTAADAASDELHYINGGAAGDILIVRAANVARTVIVKDDEATGNLSTAGDFSLDNTRDTIMLYYNGALWLELSRSDNGA